MLHEKKHYPFSFLRFFIVKSFAQPDTDQWFAPMINRINNSFEVQTIYFSTNITTPFPVTIYNNNNIAIGTVTVSKGNPQNFSVPRKYIITSKQLYKIYLLLFDNLQVVFLNYLGCLTLF
jgi:hypothetical protein